MIRHLFLGLALAFASLSGGTAAHAEDISMPSDIAMSSQPEQAKQAEQVSDDELSEQRAGFSWQGLDIRFGAEIRSYIGNELVMQTNINWNDGAAEVQRTVSAALTPGTAAELKSGNMAVSGLNLSAGNESVFLGNQGQTAFIQRTDGSIMNIIANVASNVVLRQQVDAMLDIDNYAAFRNEILTSRIGTALSAMSGLALGSRTAN